MRRALIAVALLFLGSASAQAQQQQAPAAAPAKQQFITIIRLTERVQTLQNWTAEDNQAAARHMAYLKQLTDAGAAILVGRTPTIDANTIGIVVLEAASLEEAEQVMAADPLAQAGMSTSEVLPFRVFLMRGMGSGSSSR